MYNLDESRLKSVIDTIVKNNQDDVLELLANQEYLDPIMKDEQIRKDLKRR